MNEEQKYINFQLFKWLGWVLLFLVLWFRGCGSQQNQDDTTIKEIKERKGTFKEDKPVNIPLGTIDTILLTKFVKSEPIIKYRSNEINKELANENYNLQIAYINASDSIEKLKLYIDAIQLKKFNKTFEDEFVKANVKGIAFGEVKEVGFDYVIKPQLVPETKFRLLAGVGVCNTITFDKPLFNANLGFQNKKGNIIEVGYDTEKRINVSYKSSIFKIVK